MLQASTLQFLTNLKNNNNRSWLEAHRPAYEAAKADFASLVGQVLAGLRDLDPDLARSPLEPKNCIYAMNRDIRFSADKSPYKTGMGAWFNPGGKKTPTAGYFLHIEPGGESFLAGGLHHPEPDKLALIRQEIDYNLTDFEQVLHEPSFKQYFGGLRQEDALKRPPKGYEPGNPAIEYLKLKSFTGSHPLDDDELTRPTLTAYVLALSQSLVPLVRFLNRMALGKN
jgi:uncharacterized protein (TIGR02453 family)